MKVDSKEGADSLNGAMHRLAASALATPDLRIELPELPETRMRNLVHRAAPRPVLKVSSLKMARVVQCESLLESDFALLLDASPNVEAFAEQPLRIFYLFEGSWCTHIPDFAVLCGGDLVLCEVKYSAKLDAGALKRERKLKPVLASVSAGYRTLTETEIGRIEVANAFAVLRRARHASSDVLSLGIQEQLRERSHSTLGAFGWSQPGSSAAACIAWLIVQGRANVDWSTEALTDESRVWMFDESIHEEASPWHLGLSV